MLKFLVHKTHIGICLLSCALSDLDVAKALTHQGDSVHVYSNTWGPPSTGNIARQPGYVLQMVLKAAAEEVYITIT